MLRKSPLRGLVLALALTPAAACVSSGEHEALKREFSQTRQRIEGERDAARKESFDQKKLIADLRQQIAKLNVKIEEHTATMMERDRRIADRLQQLPQEKERVRLLTEQIDACEQNLEQRGKDLVAARTALDEARVRIVTIEGELSKERAAAAELKVRLAALTAERDGLARQVDDMQAAVAELLKRKMEADARIAEFRQLVSRFQKLIDAGKLRVKIVDGRMVVELATDVLFASGSAALSRDGRTAVSEVAGILATIPDRKFQVEGHTDNVPIRTEQYPSNWELAAARALTVVKTMLDNGMPSDRISAASYGDARPAMANDSSEGKRANRRIEIVLVPDLSSLPGFDELQKAAATKT